MGIFIHFHRQMRCILDPFAIFHRGAGLFQHDVQILNRATNTDCIQ